MNNILKIVTKGWYKEHSRYGDIAKYIPIFNPSEMVLNENFWQSFSKGLNNKKSWLSIALRFHTINLIKGWDEAIKYLEDLINKDEKEK